LCYQHQVAFQGPTRSDALRFFASGSRPFFYALHCRDGAARSLPVRIGEPPSRPFLSVGHSPLSLTSAEAQDLNFSKNSISFDSAPPVSLLSLGRNAPRLFSTPSRIGCPGSLLTPFPLSGTPSLSRFCGEFKAKGYLRAVLAFLSLRNSFPLPIDEFDPSPPACTL